MPDELSRDDLLAWLSAEYGVSEEQAEALAQEFEDLAPNLFTFEGAELEEEAEELAEDIGEEDSEEVEEELPPLLDLFAIYNNYLGTDPPVGWEDTGYGYNTTNQDCENYCDDAPGYLGWTLDDDNERHVWRAPFRSMAA